MVGSILTVSNKVYVVELVDTPVLETGALYGRGGSNPSIGMIIL